MSNKSSQQTIKRRKVTFNLDAPHTKEVIIAGDFNGWDSKKHAMRQNAEGTWQKSLMLAPGKYEYKFRVDGQWVEDPHNNHSCSNCFGTRNSIIEIR